MAQILRNIKISTNEPVERILIQVLRFCLLFLLHHLPFRLIKPDRLNPAYNIKCNKQHKKIESSNINKIYLKMTSPDKKVFKISV
jgi:hypothetical protein